MTTTKHVKAARHPHLAAGADTVIAVIAVVATPLVEWVDDHVAAPLAKWRKDRTGWEQAAASIRASILLGCLIGVVIALAGCKPEPGELPGHGTEPSAVRIAPAAVEYDLCTDEMARVLGVSSEGLAAALNRQVR